VRAGGRAGGRSCSEVGPFTRAGGRAGGAARSVGLKEIVWPATGPAVVSRYSANYRRAQQRSGPAPGEAGAGTRFRGAEVYSPPPRRFAVFRGLWLTGATVYSPSPRRFAVFRGLWLTVLSTARLSFGFTRTNGTLSGPPRSQPGVPYPTGSRWMSDWLPSPFEPPRENTDFAGTQNSF